jgi:hypothetical protein
VYGECSNIAEESNDAFVRATAAMQLVQNAKENGCEVTAGTVDENTCRLFAGSAKRCTQPSIFGAANCCSAAEMGMSGMDVVGYWKMFEMSSAINEKVGVTAFMKTQWEAVATDLSGTYIGEGLGAINKEVLNVYNGIADPIKSGYNFITEPIKSGWDGMMSSLGFSPETLAAPLCVGPDCGITEALANTAAETVGEQAATTAATNAGDKAITGIYQYLAQGLNFVLETVVGEEAAKQVFAEGADGALQFADTATGEFLAAAANVLGVIMLAYQIYSLYNLAVNIAFACDEESMEVTQKKELLQTHFVGSYCSKDLFIGGCIERSLSHCVYNSTFSRIMSQQLNKIIATDTGTLERDMWLIDPSSEPRTENLKCDGFTLTQITSIDFDRVDLSEYEEIVLAKLKYDPNNMPEDFVKSAHLTGAVGPQQGATIKESGAAQARIVSSYGDNRFNADPNDLKLGDPDYMAWFEPPEGPADEDICMVQCDVANNFAYDSESGLCQKSEFSPYPATISCDTASGFVPVLDPEGNTTCQRTEVTPLILGCKDGYELDIPSGQCTKDDIRYEEKISTCPTNYRLSQDGLECELYTTADKVRGCSAYGSGFILEDGLCVQSTIETVTPLFSCANNNYNVVSGECVLSTEISVTLGCANPLVFDQATSRCIDVSLTTSPAVVDCSVHGSGYVLEGQQCVDRTITSATASCDVGYSLVGNKCEKAIAGIFPASSECPDGYQADPNDDTSCFKRSEVPVRPDPYCDDPSFTLVGNICERVTNETEPPIVDCDPGFSYSTVSNLCERNVSYAATIVCSDPNTFYNDATGFCEGSANSTQLPTLTCSDPAHTLVSDICYDYFSTGFSKSCPSGYDYNVTLDVCEQFTIEKKPPLFWCPPGTTNVGSQCYEYLTVPASISCPLPSILNTDTNMCEETQTVITSPTPICLPPSFVSGETNTCITLDTIPANLSCPFDAQNPYTLDAENRTCTRSIEDVQETVFVCDPLDPNCQLDEFAPVDFCLNGVPNAFTGECEEFDYTYPPANIFCNLATDTYNPLTNRCERVDNVAVVPCASPWGPDFVLNTITGECENVNEVAVEQECADGFAFDGTNCKRVTHSPAACSDPGMTYNSLTRTCTKTITETAVVQCHPPYENDPANIGACRLPASHTPLCANTFVPSEYNSVTNRCEHVGANISHTPSISCPSGTLNQDDTACYGGTTSAVTCPSDHTFNSSTDRCEWTPTITQGCTGDAVIVFDALTGTNRCQTLEQKLPLCEAPGYYYDSSTNECVNEDVLDGTPVCAEPSLPSQYATLEGSYCKITERTLYTGGGFCPANFYPATATFCERVIGEEPPEFTCPTDYIQNNAASESPRCIKFTTQVPTCDAGYSLVGDRCQKYSDANLAIEKCSYQGDDIFGDACLENISTAPLCQSGKYFSAEHDTCLTLTSQTPIFGCLSNNFAVNSISGLCESTLNNAPYCEAGYTLIGDLCIQDTDAPICDTANGYFYDTGLNTCRYYDSVPSNNECGPNERDTGTGCVPFDAPICDTANGWVYEPENDRCFKQVNQPYQPNCNVGFTDHLGLCVQTDPVDCAAYHPSAFWDAGSEQCVVPDSVPPIPQACSGSNEVLIGNDCFNTQTPSCSTSGYTFSAANDRCEATLISPAVETCSNGATPPLCEDTITYPGTCPTGYIATGPTTCERTTQTPSIPTCSAGLTYNHVLNQCTDTSPVTPVLECGDDADGNPINGCTTIVDNPAFISCNTGYTYNSVTNRCEDVNTATKICSNGSLQPDGTCATERGLAQYCDLTLYSALGAVGIDTGSYCLYRRFAAEPGTERSALQGAGFTCLLNTNPRTGPVGTYNCVKEQGYYERCDFTDVAGVCLEIFGDATCPSGYSPFNNTQCRQVLTQTPTCTNGYTWTGSTCQNEEDNGSGFLACTSPRTLVDSLCQLPSASYSCPSGATFINNYAGVNNDRCVTTNVDTISKQCPSGGTLQSSGMCQTTGTGDIEYSCPLGTLIVDQCHETLIQPPSCNSGFSYDPSLNVCRENVGDERPYICPSASPPYIQNGSISCDRNVFEPPFCSVGTYYPTLKACVSNGQPYNPNCAAPFIDINNRCEAYYPEAPTCPLSHPNYNGATDTCDGPQQPYDNTCDAYPGYSLMPGNPSVCEIEILSSAICPIGSQEVDGTDDLCKTFTRQPADDQCDSLGFGTVRAGSQCQTFYENTSLTCNSGARLDLEITNGHFQCHLPETQSMTTQCPFTGFTPSGLTCEELVSFPLNLQCPNGYELLTNAGGPYCEQILTDIMPEFQCSLPSNLLLDQQACRALDINPSGPIDQVCQSEEFIYDAVEGVCRLDPGNVPANEYCANPFYVLRLLPFPVDGRSYECVGELIETIDAIESCPSVTPPYTPTGNGSCSRELPAPTTYMCGPNATLNIATNMCEEDVLVVTPPEIECPEPYSVSNGQCLQIVTSSAIIACDDNIDPNTPPPPLALSEYSIVNGLCEKKVLTDTQPPIETCNGTIDPEGNCMGSISYPATPECDELNGYFYSASTGLCQKTEVISELPLSIDCLDSSHALTGTVCTYVLTLPDNGPVCPKYGDRYDSATNLCYRNYIDYEQAVLCLPSQDQRFNKCYERVNVAVDYSCPQSTVLIPPDQCEGTFVDRIDPDLSCSIGFLLGTSCIIEDKQRPVYSCSDPSYTLLNTICYQDIVVTDEEPIKTCPAGYTMTVADTCIFEDIQPALAECPDSEYIYDSATKLCQREVSERYNPTLSCPSTGHIWFGVDAKTCERVINTSPVTQTCEDPSADGSGEQCLIENLLTHAPDYCIYPAQQVGSTCETYTTQRPEFSCPALPNIIKTFNGCQEEIITTQVPITTCP